MDGAFNGKGINKLKKEDESLYNAVLALDDAVWSDGVIDRRTKKLIAIAIVASNVNESGTEKQIRSGKKQFDFSKNKFLLALKNSQRLL